MRNFTLDGRLSSAAKFVRQGARFADIGTDHAYLPIFLLESGRIDYAVCSDINEGPLASARENAREAGVYEKIDFTLADGADALRDKGVTDVAICGMGGELIGEIVGRADFLRCEGVRLILQPMSKFAFLRRELAQLGYEIEEEEYSASQGKLYLTLSASFTGEVRDITKTEAEFGKEKFLTDVCGEKREFLERRRDALTKAALGKKKGGEDASDDEELIRYLNIFLGR